MTYASTTGAVALTSAAIIVAAMSVRGGAHPTGAVTWSTVSRVLDERCLSCHGPGAAPRRGWMATSTRASPPMT